MTFSRTYDGISERLFDFFKAFFRSLLSKDGINTFSVHKLDKYRANTFRKNSNRVDILLI